MGALCGCETSAFFPIPTHHKDQRAEPKTITFYAEEFIFIKIQRIYLSWHGKREFISNFQGKMSVLKT
jgi:hypothetical protein